MTKQTTAKPVSKYAAKKQPKGTTANTAVLTKAADLVRRSSLEVAQEHQSHSTFVAFAIEGPGASVFLGDTVFRYAVQEENGCKLAVVVASDNLLVKKEDAIDLAELRDLASRRVMYRPNVNTDDIEFENARVHLINLLLSAINAEGGHSKVAKAIEDAREAERIRIENEREVKRQKKMVDEMCARIQADIENGSLSSDPIKMFDTFTGKQFGFAIDGSPVVFQTGSKNLGKRDVPTWVVMCKHLPRQIDGLTVGTFVPLYRLFDDEDGFANERMGAMAKVVVHLFGDNLEGVKQLAYELGVAEKNIRLKPEEVAVHDQQIPDVEEGGAFNFFRQGEQVPSEATVH